jgi:hypothetical protein
MPPSLLNPTTTNHLPKPHKHVTTQINKNPNNKKQVDMNPVGGFDAQGRAQGDLRKDAVFISGHKFVGGPGTPGVLVVKKRLLGALPWLFLDVVLVCAVGMGGNGVDWSVGRSIEPFLKRMRVHITHTHTYTHADTLELAHVESIKLPNLLTTYVYIYISTSCNTHAGNEVPERPGGGTVFYVTEEDHRYLRWVSRLNTHTHTTHTELQSHKTITPPPPHTHNHTYKHTITHTKITHTHPPPPKKQQSGGAGGGGHAGYFGGHPPGALLPPQGQSVTVTFV